MTDVNLKIRHAKRQNAQNLDLSEMNIEIIPPEMYQLKSVLFLDLSNNKLTDIDRAIEKMVHLKQINLENNNLSSLPYEILKLQNLSKVRLENNPFCSKLSDYELNWKESLKNYFAGKNSGTDKEIMKNTTKSPFNTNINFKLNNTAINFNSIIGSNDIKNNHDNYIKDTACNLVRKNAPLKIKSNQEITGENKNVTNNAIKMKKSISNMNIVEDEIKTFTKNDKSKSKDLTSNELSSDEKQRFVDQIRNYESTLAAKAQLEESLRRKISNIEVELERHRKEKKDLPWSTPHQQNQEQITNSVKSRKRDWLDIDTTLKSVSKASSNSQIFDSETGKVKEVETQLQKEILNNKRLKIEVERLSQKLASSTLNQGGDAAFKSKIPLK